MCATDRRRVRGPRGRTRAPPGTRHRRGQTARSAAPQAARPPRSAPSADRAAGHSPTRDRNDVGARGCRCPPRRCARWRPTAVARRASCRRSAESLLAPSRGNRRSAPVPAPVGRDAATSPPNALSCAAPDRRRRRGSSGQSHRTSISSTRRPAPSRATPQDEAGARRLRRRSRRSPWPQSPTVGGDRRTGRAAPPRDGFQR